MWRIQLFNYVAFTIALTCLVIRYQLNSFNRLVALHLTYMNLVSAMTGSQLIHPTYFVYNHPSTRIRQRAWHAVVVNIVYALGGLVVPVIVCISRGSPTCRHYAPPIKEVGTLSWIVLFGVYVGQQTAYALMLSLACIISLLHIGLSLAVVPKYIHYVVGPPPVTLSHSGRKYRLGMTDIAVVAFFVYWIQDVMAIERSLVLNFGDNINAQNSWGFGQVRVVNTESCTTADALSHRSFRLSSCVPFWRRFGGMSCHQC
jgi:hypothetical protein